MSSKGTSVEVSQKEHVYWRYRYTGFYRYSWMIDRLYT